MAGTFNIGGLITGLDSNTIISQLMSIEKQPITRLQTQISTYQKQQSSIRELRTQLMTLRSSAQDFRFSSIIAQYKAASSESTVLGADVSGSNPVIGSYVVNVTQLASATVATSSNKLGSAISPTAMLNADGMTTSVSAGTFSINGVSLTVDPATQSLNQILGQINSSAAGVTASYNSGSDAVTIRNTAPGNTNLINFGATDDTSNFLDALNIRQATQATGSGGSTTATSTRNLGAIDTSKKLNATGFASGAVTAGTIQVNGISINVDPTNDTIMDVIQRINDSDAQVTATYDTSSDKIRVVAKTLGSRTASFTSGTSNFLAVTNLTTATQTAGNDAQFTINGGAVQTRNTNEVSDAVGGVTLRLLSIGSSTVTISGDDDKVVKGVQDFVKAFNDTIDKIETLTGTDGALHGDGTIQQVEWTLRGTIFSAVSGISGDYNNLTELGITTGDTFDVNTTSHLTLDENTLREALRTNRTDVASVFHNNGGTGIADQLFTYLDSATQMSGFLNERARANGTIDDQIKALNDQISTLQTRVTAKETRLKQQFSQLEQYAATMQSQGATISNLGKGTTSIFG